MKSKMIQVTGGAIALVLAMGACAGTKLNDVGDLNGSGNAGGGTSGGKANADGAGSSSVGPDAGGMASGGEVSPPEPPIEGVGASAGAGGADPGPVFECDTCQPIVNAPEVRALWAATDKLYWIEYGSFDHLGNYQGNGRLLSLSYDENDNEPTVVSAELEGPTQLAVTEDFAYFILDQSSSGGGEAQLARISVGGGDVEPLQTIPTNPDERRVMDGTLKPSLDWFRTYFAAGGGYVYWRNAEVLYRLSESSEDPLEEFLEAGESTTLLADATSLYLHHAAGISSVLHTSPDISPVWVSSRSLHYHPVVLAGTAFYTLDTGERSYLAKLPKAGGAVQRLSEAPSPWATRIETDGTTFVADFAIRAEPALIRALREGQLDDPSTVRTLATAPSTYSENGTPSFRLPAWASTATTVYLGYENQLYRIARQP